MARMPDELRYFDAHGVDCLTATLDRHRYAPHAHAEFVIGAVVRGEGEIAIAGRRHRVGPGDITLYNPGEVHDGSARAPGFRYAACYPRPELVEALVADAGARRHGSGGAFRFGAPIVRDPGAAHGYLALHRRWESAGDPLQVEEGLACFLAACLERHAGVAPAPAGREPAGLVRAVDLMHARAGDKLTLEQLAQAAGLPRQRLIRAFRRATGFTPHAFLLNVRANLARTLLRAGAEPLAAAVGAGFADQAHLNRAFKARFGVPPGAFRRAIHPAAAS
jgi:AraC-like DNA-binding protein